jgi:iron-sulfur cluster repair protein YtfE (RIC family)
VALATIVSHASVYGGHVSKVGDLLKRDHRELEALFEDFDRGEGRGVALKICETLEVHAEAEDQIVYPALRDGVTLGRDLADEAEWQHAQARQLIARIRQTTDDEQLAALVGGLKEAVDHHVAQEEGTVFPKMESDLGLLEMDVLGVQVEEFKSSALK